MTSRPGRVAFTHAVAWSTGVWSVLIANAISTRIGDTPARYPIHHTQENPMPYHDPDARHAAVVPANPLTNVLTPKIRAWLYAALFVASTFYGVWQAADGDWKSAIGSGFAALMGLIAGANASYTPVKPGDQRGYGALELIVGVILLLVLLWIVLALFGGTR